MIRFICVALLVGLLIVATTSVVFAESQSVTVTANPKFYATGLTATYINDYEIGLEWSIAPNVTKVMIRSKWGSTPTSKDDGILVYYGDATNMTHFLQSSLAFATEPLYYSLWSEMGDGSWSPSSTDAGGDFMSSTILFIVVSIMALGLSLGYTWKRQGFFAYAATAFWLFLGLLAYQTSTSPSPLEFTDIYMGLFWVCMGMTITFVLLPTLTREKPTPSEITEEWEGEDMSSFGERKETKFQPKKRSRFQENGAM